MRDPDGVDIDTEAIMADVRERMHGNLLDATIMLHVAVRDAAPRRSGYLAKSVSSNVNKKKLEGTVSVKAPHAHLIEYGWVHKARSGKLTHIPANPFARRTFAAIQDRLIAKMQEGL